MTSEKIWHAVFTQPGCEKKVAKQLSRKNIECYCALNRIVHQWSDRKKTLYYPLFKNYVFVHIAKTDFLTIKKIEGITNFVYWLGSPAVIQDEEIQAIKDFLEEHEDVQLDKIPVNVTERVRMVEEPMRYNEGSDLDLQSQSVKLSLPSLGAALIAEVRKNSVEMIQQYKADLTKIA